MTFKTQNMAQIRKTVFQKLRVNKSVQNIHERWKHSDNYFNNPISKHVSMGVGHYVVEDALLKIDHCVLKCLLGLQVFVELKVF